MSEAPTTLELPVPKRSRWFWLRIAVSVFFGLVTVALCVLWVRSYWRVEVIQLTSPKYLCQFGYCFGRILLDVEFVGPVGTFANTGVSMMGLPASDEDRKRLNAGSTLGFRYTHNVNAHLGTQTIVSIPFLLPVGSAFALAIAFLNPSPYRFSLRTLLIATTLVAVLLVLVVWMVR